jgi:hypothetical protein
MSMDQISIPVRRAGLDQDPGWVPDLAQIVLFHFDEGLEMHYATSPLGVACG